MMFNLRLVLVLLVVVLVSLDVSNGWRRRRRRRRQPSSGSVYVNRGGYGGSYNFGNGFKVQGSGNWNGGYQVGVSYTWTGKREVGFLPGTLKDSNSCKTCLHILPISSKQLKKTKLKKNAALVLMVKFLDEKQNKENTDTRVRFKIIEILRSPAKNMKEGMFFTLDAKKAHCPCLPKLGPGIYTMFGFNNKQNQLVVSGALLKITQD